MHTQRVLSKPCLVQPRLLNQRSLNKSEDRAKVSSLTVSPGASYHIEQCRSCRRRDKGKRSKNPSSSLHIVRSTTSAGYSTIKKRKPRKQILVFHLSPFACHPLFFTSVTAYSHYCTSNQYQQRSTKCHCKHECVGFMSHLCTFGIVSRNDKSLQSCISHSSFPSTVYPLRRGSPNYCYSSLKIKKRQTRKRRMVKATTRAQSSKLSYCQYCFLLYLF